MKEILSIRINYEFAHHLFAANEGKDLGTSVKLIEISRNDPRYNEIPAISKKVELKHNRSFFYGWEIKRQYSKKELDSAPLLHCKIKPVFEPAGEECGTVYDDTVACSICGAGGKQISPLKLSKGSIPKKDVARTIAGEIVVSHRFIDVAKKRGLKGLECEEIIFKKGDSNYFQLKSMTELELSSETIVGINPFDLSTSSGKEIYKCLNGDTIGLNLLSEPHVEKSDFIGQQDFLASKQTIGVRRGLLRPEPIYFCSQAFRNMVLDEKLTGFKFEIAHVH